MARQADVPPGTARPQPEQLVSMRDLSSQTYFRRTIFANLYSQTKEERAKRASCRVELQPEKLPPDHLRKHGDDFFFIALLIY
jgi:hypothetical protein